MSKTSNSTELLERVYESISQSENYLGVHTESIKDKLLELNPKDEDIDQTIEEKYSWVAESRQKIEDLKKDAQKTAALNTDTINVEELKQKDLNQLYTEILSTEISDTSEIYNYAKEALGSIDFEKLNSKELLALNINALQINELQKETLNQEDRSQQIQELLRQTIALYNEPNDSSDPILPETLEKIFSKIALNDNQESVAIESQMHALEEIKQFVSEDIKPEREKLSTLGSIARLMHPNEEEIQIDQIKQLPVTLLNHLDALESKADQVVSSEDVVDLMENRLMFADKKDYQQRLEDINNTKDLDHLVQNNAKTLYEQATDLYNNLEQKYQETIKDIEKERENKLSKEVDGLYDKKLKDLLQKQNVLEKKLIELEVRNKDLSGENEFLKIESQTATGKQREIKELESRMGGLRENFEKLMDENEKITKADQSKSEDIKKLEQTLIEVIKNSDKTREELEQKYEQRFGSLTESYEKNIESLQGKVVKLEQQLLSPTKGESKENTKSLADDILDAFSKPTETQQPNILELNKQITAVQKELETTKLELIKVTNQLKVLQEIKGTPKTNDKELENNKLKDENERFKLENQQLKSQFEQINKSNEGFKADLVKANEINEKLKQESLRKEQEKSNIDKDAQKQIQTLKSQNTKLKIAQALLTNNNRDLKGRNEFLESSEEYFKKESEIRDQLLDVQTKELASYKKRLYELELENTERKYDDTKDNQIEEYQQANLKLKEELEKLTALNLELNRKLRDQVQSTKTEDNKFVKELKNNLQKAENNLQKTENKLAKALEDNSKSAQEKAQLEKELKDQKQSFEKKLAASKDERNQFKKQQPKIDQLNKSIQVISDQNEVYQATIANLTKQLEEQRQAHEKQSRELNEKLFNTESIQKENERKQANQIETYQQRFEKQEKQLEEQKNENISLKEQLKEQSIKLENQEKIVAQNKDLGELNRVLQDNQTYLNETLENKYKEVDVLKEQIKVLEIKNQDLEIKNQDLGMENLDLKYHEDKTSQEKKELQESIVKGTQAFESDRSKLTEQLNTQKNENISLKEQLEDKHRIEDQNLELQKKILEQGQQLNSKSDTESKNLELQQKISEQNTLLEKQQKEIEKLREQFVNEKDLEAKINANSRDINEKEEDKKRIQQQQSEIKKLQENSKQQELAQTEQKRLLEKRQQEYNLALENIRKDYDSKLQELQLNNERLLSTEQNKAKSLEQRVQEQQQEIKTLHDNSKQQELVQAEQKRLFEKQQQEIEEQKNRRIVAEKQLDVQKSQNSEQLVKKLTSDNLLTMEVRTLNQKVADLSKENLRLKEINGESFGKEIDIKKLREQLENTQKENTALKREKEDWFNKEFENFDVSKQFDNTQENNVFEKLNTKASQSTQTETQIDQNKTETPVNKTQDNTQQTVAQNQQQNQNIQSQSNQIDQSQEKAIEQNSQVNQRQNQIQQKDNLKETGIEVKENTNVQQNSQTINQNQIQQKDEALNQQATEKQDKNPFSDKNMSKEQFEEYQQKANSNPFEDNPFEGQAQQNKQTSKNSNLVEDNEFTEFQTAQGQENTLKQDTPIRLMDDDDQIEEANKTLTQEQQQKIKNAESKQQQSQTENKVDQSQQKSSTNKQEEQLEQDVAQDNVGDGKDDLYEETLRLKAEVLYHGTRSGMGEVKEIFRSDDEQKKHDEKKVETLLQADKESEKLAEKRIKDLSKKKYSKAQRNAYTQHHKKNKMQPIKWEKDKNDQNISRAKVVSGGKNIAELESKRCFASIADGYSKYSKYLKNSGGLNFDIVNIKYDNPDGSMLHVNLKMRNAKGDASSLPGNEISIHKTKDGKYAIDLPHEKTIESCPGLKEMEKLHKKAMEKVPLEKRGEVSQQHKDAIEQLKKKTPVVIIKEVEINGKKKKELYTLPMSYDQYEKYQELGRASERFEAIYKKSETELTTEEKIRLKEDIDKIVKREEELFGKASKINVEKRDKCAAYGLDTITVNKESNDKEAQEDRGASTSEIKTTNKSESQIQTSDIFDDSRKDKDTTSLLADKETKKYTQLNPNTPKMSKQDNVSKVEYQKFEDEPEEQESQQSKKQTNTLKQSTKYTQLNEDDSEIQENQQKPNQKDEQGNYKKLTEENTSPQKNTEIQEEVNQIMKEANKEKSINVKKLDFSDMFKSSPQKDDNTRQRSNSVNLQDSVNLEKIQKNSQRRSSISIPPKVNNGKNSKDEQQRH